MEASEQPPLLDFADFYGSNQLSDVTIVLCMDAEAQQEPAEPPAKRARTEQAASGSGAAPAPAEELPGHGLLLAGHSSYFKSELTRWQQPEAQQTCPRSARQAESQPSSNEKPRIVLRLSSQAEMDAARAMVAYMYTRSLPEGASQEVLLTMLQLADRFGVQTCSVACSDALSKQELSMQTITQLLVLPPFYHDSPLFSALMSSAADVLQQAFGDLEEAWARKDSHDAFLQLPLKGVELLLADDRTRVHSENTVLVAVAAWVHQHSDSLAAADKRRLAELIRCPFLTPFCAASVAMQIPWLVEALGSVTLGCAIALSHALSSSSALSISDCVSGMWWPESWALGKRPASARTSICLTWQPQLVQLPQSFEEGDTRLSPGSVLGGFSWHIIISRKESSRGTEGDSASEEERQGQKKGTLGVYVQAQLTDELGVADEYDIVVAMRKGSLTAAQQADAEDGEDDIVIPFDDSSPTFCAAKGWGAGDFFETGGMTEWAPQHFAEFVDSDGRLNLCLKIEEFL